MVVWWGVVLCGYGSLVESMKAFISSSARPYAQPLPTMTSGCLAFFRSSQALATSFGSASIFGAGERKQFRQRLPRMKETADRLDVVREPAQMGPKSRQSERKLREMT